ncbi:DUF262 domain-containing protein [Polaribacter atrinae]|uniref:DUF262 domain-containing protein n=1 Tax=Polaribacter atrinae TaxID=1333662 RepID=UPI002490B6F8|nr:DUF262 domain-containing protein [Polaribacter atrinae]
MEKSINDVLEKNIIPLKDLLFLDKLKVPEYQRPYKWTVRNVIQLLNDITAHKDKPSYRIGTIVFHKEVGENASLKHLNIVDGQQRLYTLTLIAIALAQQTNTKTETERILKNRVDYAMLNQPVRHDISKNNLAINFKEIQREVSHFEPDAVRFFFNKCEVVTIQLNTVSEAFQFFDSQNARGKDLAPHDLLKAFHLREMKDIPQLKKQEIIATWETADENKKLAPLFAENLYRVKAWCKYRNGRYFGKNDNYLFKGIKASNKETYPFAKAYTMNHFYTEQYNTHPHRALDNRYLDFPFQLDQPIINGQRFFDMVKHYSKIMEHIEATENQESLINGDVYFVPKDINSNFYRILYVLASYDKRHRQGDRYVRNLFNNALLYYLDKFGTAMLEENIIKLFIWAYSLRLKMQAVKLASMDNHTRESIRLFGILREATNPTEIQRIYLPQLKISEVKASGMGTTSNENNNKIYTKNQEDNTLLYLFQQFKYISFE